MRLKQRQPLSLPVPAPEKIAAGLIAIVGDLIY